MCYILVNRVLILRDFYTNSQTEMKLKLKIIWDSKITKVILATFSILLLAMAVILPSALTARKTGQLIAFNRDATSGTREAFIEKVLGEDPDEFTPGKNVLEASNNESMIKSVIKNKYSVAYVSAGTIAELGEDSLTIKDKYVGNVGVAGYEDVMPNLTTISNGEYAPQRNFNAFFRVEEGSEEAKIVDWQTEDVTGLDDNLKASYAFYYWFQYSQEAHDFINQGSEIAYTDRGRIPITWDNFEKYWDKTELESKDIRIEIVGSSSAQATMHELTDYVLEKVNEQYPDTNVQFIIATNGSGDAFKETVPGTTGADYIGMQSREAKESELESWGYDETNSSDFYMPFAIDAILIIYNTKGLANPEQEYYVTEEAMNRLYTVNDVVMFEEVFFPTGGDA